MNEEINNLNFNQQNNQNETQKNNHKNKGIVGKIIAAVVITLIVVAVVIGVTNKKPQYTYNNQKIEILSSNMDVTYSVLFDDYSCKITGTAKNTSNYDFSYVSIEFSVYDANSYNLGSAFDNISNLASGEVWSFEAILLSSPKTKPTMYRLSDITTISK